MTTRQRDGLQLGDCVSISGNNGQPIYGTVVFVGRELVGITWQLVIEVEHNATNGDSRYPTHGSRQLVQRTTYKAETVDFKLESRPISKQAAGSKRAMRATSRHLSDIPGPAVQQRPAPPRPGNRPVLVAAAAASAVPAAAPTAPPAAAPAATPAATPAPHQAPPAAPPEGCMSLAPPPPPHLGAPPAATAPVADPAPRISKRISYDLKSDSYSSFESQR